MKLSTIKKFIIKGPVKINGEVNISGAKNAALPILAATLLSKKSITLRNTPKLLDIISILESLCYLGSNICLNDDQSITLCNKDCVTKPIGIQFTQKTRGSILLLGPLLSRFGQAKIAMPGGCNFGSRPIDIHLSGLIQLGANIDIVDDNIHASAPNGLTGATIKLPKSSVGATENLIMAATFASGTTIIHNSAIEPEIFDLITFINKMGGNVQHLEGKTIRIIGVNALEACEHTIIGDRIEAGTYLIAAAATQGNVTVKNVSPKDLTYVLEKLKEWGAEISTSDSEIHLRMTMPPKAVDIKTLPFPGFPTDLQAQWLALNIVSSGKSSITDTIYETRTSHVSELQKLDAKLNIDDKKIVSNGLSRLKGGNINATDIRASAGLIIAGCCAEGETHIHNTTFIDRGYVAFDEKLRKLGVDIKRTKVSQ